MDALHPLAQSTQRGNGLPAAELRFELSVSSLAASSVVLECVYRPWRRRDVRRTRRFHLFSLPWRIGSRDWTTVQSEESHTERHEVAVVDGRLEFTVALHASTREYAKYRLADVRVAGAVFSRWFPEPPALPREFGLEIGPTTQSGEVRLDGLGAEPLRGALPLWPQLREVQLRIRPAERSRIELWDPGRCHAWDGWLVDPPEAWLGGRTIAARHASSPVVWRSHEYVDVPPLHDPPFVRASPPPEVPLGIGLEVDWASGDTLEFPDVRFAGDVEVIGFSFDSLPTRVAELLEASVCRRPGLALHTLAESEWNELDALADSAWATVVDVALDAIDGDRAHLSIRRRSLAQSFLLVFGIACSLDDVKPVRWEISTLLMHPSPAESKRSG